MVEHKIIVTADGSHSIQVEGTALTYHSLHGALQESMHVFIETGLKPLLGRYATLRILEMGLGTGLNAWLTWYYSQKAQQPVYYYSIEAFPLPAAAAGNLNYSHQLNEPAWQMPFLSLHEAAWNQPVQLDEGFTIHKKNENLMQLAINEAPFHLFYFDAFAPSAQPELWTEDIFKKLLLAAAPGASLLTYCSKSVVRRAMQAAGWQVTKLPGPKWKREMVRAFRP